MGIEFTEDQKKVIDLRNRSILVSAAAGSGKTAVLVERIIRLVRDKNHPVDVDRILVMTFTNAAAAEMKARISKALEAALSEEPRNAHLQRQITLVNTAQICTINSFCTWLIRNYFHLIDLDPGFRTGEEAEMKLLQQDTLKEFLVSVYEREDPAVSELLECYSPDKGDDQIVQQILALYTKAVSNPNPREWLHNCTRRYDIDGENQFEESDWLDDFFREVYSLLQEAVALVSYAQNICEEPGGSVKLGVICEEEADFLTDLMPLAEDRNYDTLYERLSAFVPKRAPGGKAPAGESKELKEKAKELRDREKEIVKILQEEYFSSPWEEVLLTSKVAAGPLRTLTLLTEEFMDVYRKKKKEKNLMDFSDQEHYALEILRKNGEDVSGFGSASLELREKYEEVMIDEYQDSNQVQEAIAQCVCRQNTEGQAQNLFMVGDVKQSIYRFRMACPELFMGKYKQFTVEEGPQQKIDLHQNFRSRREVLSSANDIFHKLMEEDLGGVTYDEAAALNYGANYEKSPRGNDDYTTELLLLDGDSGEDSAGERLNSKEARQLEARMIARRIRKMVGNERISDSSAVGGYRTIEYRDIVILLRSAENWSQEFAKELSLHGIPVFSASKKGYFTAVEIQTLLNYLRILNNPLQDIPLLGVLRSPMAAFSANDLGAIRASYPAPSLYESLKTYLSDGQERLFEDTGEKSKERKEKALRFMAQYEKLRGMVSYTPVHRLIPEILKETGYENICRVLPEGEQKTANLSMLVEKAREYEKSSYRGLFNFIRYIEQLDQYEVDFGEANISGAGDGAVQLMTIHKSKGLEFPVVFVSGLGKKFNQKDIKDGILMDDRYGIAGEAIDPGRRLHIPSLQKSILSRRLKEDMLGEEIRILYVAMTRAKEKMILTGSDSGILEKVRRLRENPGITDSHISLQIRKSAKSPLDWILASLAHHPAMERILEEEDIAVPEDENDREEDFRIVRYTAESLLTEELPDMIQMELEEEQLSTWFSGQIGNEDLHKELEKRFQYQYPSWKTVDIPVKVSVSDLKKRKYQTPEDEEAKQVVSEKEEKFEEILPRFLQERHEDGTIRGAERGTAYHRVMECLDYEILPREEENAAMLFALSDQLQQMLKEEKLSEIQYETIDPEDILIYLRSPLGIRMRLAGREGRLRREQPFMIARNASELNSAWESTEDVLVQGIIDAYFTEGQEIVLVDYKTDKVYRETKLVDLYRIQLEMYKEALERITGRSVKETYIYSFTLQKEIKIC